MCPCPCPGVGLCLCPSHICLFIFEFSCRALLHLVFVVVFLIVIVLILLFVCVFVFVFDLSCLSFVVGFGLVFGFFVLIFLSLSCLLLSSIELSVHVRNKEHPFVPCLDLDPVFYLDLDPGLSWTRPCLVWLGPCYLDLDPGLSWTRPCLVWLGPCLFCVVSSCRVLSYFNLALSNFALSRLVSRPPQDRAMIQALKERGKVQHHFVVTAEDHCERCCLVVPCLALPASPCIAFPCFDLPSLVLPCLALPCLALPCLVLPCLALPNLV